MLFFFLGMKPELLVNRVRCWEFTSLRAIFDICDLNSVSKQSGAMKGKTQSSHDPMSRLVTVITVTNSISTLFAVYFSATCQTIRLS